ncbi:type II toxin-antitoxin system VapC family toxin [Tolypothrix sp. PCC 7910]|uniref:type II toxin-antitoxin system VapC family toxin n=1 Tax=Tolypothrix sp. PCC 7910 TaxID=2099387 RepID=UPI0014276FDD|nr:type II toxin-antitoxin system VapC family toxin [Tolypothrix sp. PCC 7910]QIR39984.1 type II toxin-antitoxin system VapC family toxin [Tolypothrix sp. PCC 7910]
MKFLLDTQAFLWFVLNDRALSQIACDLIVEPFNDILLSPASYWEIAIKVSIGKYEIHGDFATWIEHQIQVNELEILPIKVSHVAALVTLPFHHKDPFDRLLVAQALTEEIPIISVDAILDNYAVTRYW